MSAKHTPGPWRMIVDDTGDEFTGWPSVVASDEIDASVVHRAGFKQEYWGDLSLRETLANARLIAAAPELLAALIAAEQKLVDLEHAVGGGDGEIYVEGAILAARAAIAKATGGVKQ